MTTEKMIEANQANALLSTGAVTVEMKDKKAIITLREPFDRLVAVSDHPKCRKR
jgi:hypothetical protein